MKIRMIAAAVMALALSAGAQAATSWSDNFDANTLGTDKTPTGWFLVGPGDVDIIGDGFFDFLPGNGKYIDLDGSDGKAGTLTTSLALDPGSYSVSFDLAGNHRFSTGDVVTVVFGATTASYTVGASDAFATHTLTTASAGPITLSFHDSVDGNVGALLDNVNVTAVPEPGSLSLMFAGIAALGFAARRRRS